MKKVDPITLAVVRNNLISVANGMQETAFRCAVTTYLYEIMDCSFSLLDDEAGVIAEAHGMLLFLGSLGPAVRNCIGLIGKENLSPGDVIVAAHPDITGAHTSDALVFSPIFYKKRLFGFAATKSHWLDLGRRTPFPPTRGAPSRRVCAYPRSGFTANESSSRTSGKSLGTTRERRTWCGAICRPR